MKNKILNTLIMGLLCFSASFAQTESPLQQANELYKSGNFVQAAEIYENTLRNSGISSELYYNLGNCYFKMNEIGRSVLNYERALRLAPNYADARHNLEFAQQRVIDNIPASDSFFLKRWMEKMLNLCNSNSWLYISVASFLLTIALVLLFIFGNNHAVRKIAFYIAIILLVFSALTLAFAGLQKHIMTSHTTAIVMNGAVTVKSSPDQSGTDLFVLHEGTKLTVVSTLNTWVEIKLGNGSVGWVEQQTIERI